MGVPSLNDVVVDGTLNSTNQPTNNHSDVLVCEWLYVCSKHSYIRHPFGYELGIKIIPQIGNQAKTMVDEILRLVSKSAISVCGDRCEYLLQWSMRNSLSNKDNGWEHIEKSI